MAMTEAMQLMGNREKFSPTAQQEILHEWTAVVAGPVRAARLAPIEKGQGVTDAERDATFAFGSLMHGVPIKSKPELNPIEQIETLIGMLAGVMSRIAQQTNLATPNELAGLKTVVQYIGGLIQDLSQNPNEKQRVTAYGKMLGKLVNEIKGFEQRLQQQQAKNGEGGLTGEDHAKMAASLTKASIEGKIKERKAAQQMAHKEKAFQMEQQRRNVETVAEVGREHLKAGAEHQRKKRFSAFEA
jgi:hypothetical protein